jgi:hypothetical protein
VSTDASDAASVTAEPAPGEQGGVRIFRGQLFRERDGRGWTFTSRPPTPPPAPVRRPARVAQMLALAHRLDGAIARGEFEDRADLARQLGLTRARITQLLDLTLLAPDIQERVLLLEAIEGREPISERELRRVSREALWSTQRAIALSYAHTPSTYPNTT